MGVISPFGFYLGSIEMKNQPTRRNEHRKTGEQKIGEHGHDGRKEYVDLP